ncbi:hypothetical protein Glove_230g153 [Diversispora epigaea]|uniref:Rab-GAP TBC domain-containing protein n=1 Tax=Diversispora epigaea TaxID=1348612 RepID=A0A397IJZ5_9GLOM|nr:hypothetical protein Glove_230g153 [Diversispora epigaea]
MAPVLLLPSQHCLSPYGSTLREKPLNSLMNQSQQYFKKSTSNLIKTTNVTSSDGNPLSRKVSNNNKPLVKNVKIIKNVKNVKNEKDCSQKTKNNQNENKNRNNNKNQNNKNDNNNKSISNRFIKHKADASTSSISSNSSSNSSIVSFSSATSSSSSSHSSSNALTIPLRRLNSHRNDKPLNGFEELLNTTHKTQREVKASLSKLRRMVLVDSLPDENLPKLAPSVQSLIRPNSLRSKVWKHFLGVYHVSANEYLHLIQKGKSCVYDKIRNDTFRTLATDKKFSERVNEEMLIRVLNALAWKVKSSKIKDHQSITYVQGMNVLLAPFLFTMSELDAYFSFATFIQNICPLYVTPTLEGVHCGLKLLNKCLQILDLKLFTHLKSKNLTAEIYAFPSVLTLCACTPPLEQVLKLWDFLFAYGIHLNIICVIAQLILIRDQLLDAPSPMKLLRTMPELNAKSIINLTVQLVQQIPDDLYEQLVRHPFDPTVAASLTESESPVTTINNNTNTVSATTRATKTKMNNKKNNNNNKTTTTTKTNMKK